MKTSSAKAKGRRLQDSVKNHLMNNLPLLPGDVKCAIMGEKGVDIHLSSSALAIFPFAIECKNNEHISIWKAWTQTEDNAVCECFNLNREDIKPLLVMTRNRSPELVVLKIEDFMKLVSRGIDSEKRI